MTPEMTKLDKDSIPLPSATQETVDIKRHVCLRQSRATKIGLYPGTRPLGAGAEAALDPYPGRMTRPVKSPGFLMGWGGLELESGIHPTKLWIFKGNTQPIPSPFLKIYFY